MAEQRTQAQSTSSQSVGMPAGLVLAALLFIAGWLLFHRPGPLLGLVLVVHVVAVVIGARVWWARWFPHRATREVNKVLARARLDSQAKLIRRKCRRDGHQWVLAWRMPTGATTSGLTKLSEVFEHALDCSATFWFSRGLMWMRAGTAQLPDLMTFEEFYRHPAPAGELVFGVGFGRTGPVWMDLTRVPHKLVGGTTGAGKSVYVRQALVCLLLRYGPEHVRLVLIDLKGGLEFNTFRRLPHLLLPIVSDLPEVAPAIETVLAELDRRKAMFAEADVVNIQEWNRRNPADRLPYILVAVDEYGEVSMPAVEASNDKARAHSPKMMHAGFSRIARLGRALGIHLLACTQRPDTEVLPGQIKAQMPATVAFRCRGEVNSHILLGDHNDSAALLPPIAGRAVFQWEDEQPVQAPYLLADEAAALLAAKYGQPVGHARVTQCPTCPDEIEGDAA